MDKKQNEKSSYIPVYTKWSQVNVYTCRLEREER